MKNSYFVLISIIVCFYFAGCGDNGFDTPEPLMKVTKSEVVFDSKGGNGSIEVDAPQSISATVDKSWCTLSVSENKIAVTVTENKSIERRNATVTIVSGGETEYVSVSQSGAISDIRIPQSARISMGGDSLEYVAKFDFSIDVKIDVNWISYKLINNKLILKVSPSEEKRKGVVSISTKYIVGNETKTKVQTLTVNQDILTYKHFLGEWKLSYINAITNTTTRTEIDVVLKQKEGVANTYILSGFPVGSASGALNVDYSVVDGNNLFAIAGKQKQPDVDGFDVYSIILSEDTKAINEGTSLSYQGKFQQSNGKMTIVFSDNGSWPGRVIGGLLLATYNKGGGYKGDIYCMNKIIMTKK